VLALTLVLANPFAAFSQTNLSSSSSSSSFSSSLSTTCPSSASSSQSSYSANTASPLPSLAWPKVRGPFSWADKLMNSSVIARGGEIYRLREKIQGLYRPTLEIKSYDAFQTRLRPVSTDISFFSYAINNNMLEDAAALLFARNYYAPSDTLQYLRGLVSYEVKDFERAYDCFSAISPVGGKSVSSPVGTLNPGNSSINHPNTSAGETSLYDKAQLFLDVYSSEPEISLKYKNRSPLLAAAMSAVIPGAGKIYAGDLSSGVSTMLIVGALGAMTAESIVKLGIRDWRSISLASIFGLFYIGNIYGRYLSVSIIQNTISDAEKATLLFNIRIPLHELPK
jgi:TM2 domain-containing membrane protein YozV